MTYGFEEHKALIYELYLVQNKTQKEVQRELRRSKGFKAKERCWRKHIRDWGYLKKIHRSDSPSSTRSSYSRSSTCHRGDILKQGQSRPFSPASLDSGYCSESLRRASYATTVSTPWPDIASIGNIPQDLLNTSHQTKLSSHATPLNTPRASSITSNITTLTDKECQVTTEPDPTGISWTDTIPLRVHHTANPSNEPTPNSQNTGPSRQPQNKKASLTKPEPWFNPSGYSSGHSSPSRCRVARSNLSIPSVGLHSCQYCGATEMHCLATKKMDKIMLMEQIQLLSKDTNLNKCDIFENNPSHFLAGSAPTREQIRVFHRAGIDLFKRNSDGETFLHVLDPSNLVSQMPDLLIWFHEQRPGFLRQRTHHGKTILHSLLEQSCFMDTPKSFELLFEVLVVFQSVKNDLKARCNQGSTAMDRFLVKWMEKKGLRDRSSEELETLNSISATFGADLILQSLDGSELLPVTLCDGMIPQLLSPTGRNSGDLTLQNLESRDREMLAIIDKAYQDPLAQDYRARNALHCLASISRLWRHIDASEPLAARKDVLVILLNLGVAVNEFDILGSTPLHYFLSYPRLHEEDNTIALFIKIMTQDFGADIHMRDRKGDDALHLACRAGRVSCTEILLCLGANVDARNYKGRSVIEDALREKRNSNPEDAARIQDCITRVKRANGFEDPIEEEDLLYNQSTILNNSYPGSTPMQATSFVHIS